MRGIDAEVRQLDTITEGIEDCMQSSELGSEDEEIANPVVADVEVDARSDGMVSTDSLISAPASPLVVHRRPRSIPLSPYQVEEQRRSERILRMQEAKKKYSSLMMLRMGTDCDEPNTYAEAIASSDSENWKKAMDDEMNSLIENQTWVLASRKEAKNIVTCRWVFKKKRNELGEVVRFKARLCARGFTQEQGVDYEEIYSPTVKFCVIRTGMAISIGRGYEIHQADVDTAFLYGNIDKKIFMAQAPGYEKGERGELVCRLKKSIYGLKQSPRLWWIRLEVYLTQIGFTRSMTDMAMYVKKHEDGRLTYLTVYVDDILIFVKLAKDALDVKNDLRKEFKIKDLGRMKYCLGIEA